MDGPVRGVCVGRFQPFHRGHLELIREIHRHRGEELLVVIGSAEQSYTWENPFTAGERYEMIDRALREARIDRVAIVPVPDISRHGMWVRYLETLLPKFDRVYSHNPLTRLLFERAGYPVRSPPLYRRSVLEGSRLRERLARGESLARYVPPAVGRYLEEVHAADRLAGLRPDRRRGAR
jgi:nicotinamide-nucleotide adenylyltransferase